MYGNNKTICIAGKNSCAIEALKFVVRNCRIIKLLLYQIKVTRVMIHGKNLLGNLQKEKVLK